MGPGDGAGAGRVAVRAGEAQMIIEINAWLLIIALLAFLIIGLDIGYAERARKRHR